MKKETYELALKINRIGNRTVRKAQQENHRLGLANVYSRHNSLYYEWPDGTITTDNARPTKANGRRVGRRTARRV